MITYLLSYISYALNMRISFPKAPHELLFRRAKNWRKFAGGVDNGDEWRKIEAELEPFK